MTNPLVNSYKRLRPGFEAPVYIAWSTLGTNTLIRVPNIRGEHTRIELRSPDPSANPYLAIAACLMAGLDGIRNQIEPEAEVRDNINALAEEEAVRRGIGKLPMDLLRRARRCAKTRFCGSCSASVSLHSIMHPSLRRGKSMIRR